MTSYVASLFLPQTLGFLSSPTKEQHQQQASHTPQQQLGSNKLNPLNIPTLLETLASRNASNSITRHDTPALSPTPPLTPHRGNIASPDQGAASTGEDSLGSLSARLSKVKVDPVAAQSRRVLSIPRSQASSPPEAAIVTPRPTFQRTSSKTRPADVEDLSPVAQCQSKTRSNLSHRKSLSTVINPAYANAPFETFDQDMGNGGLRNAISAAFEAGKIKKPIWVGLPGIPTDEIGSQTLLRIQKDFELRLNSLIVDVRDDVVNKGYDHFCKRILWPLFHYQVPDNPRQKIYEEHSWMFYEQMNQAFADRICERYKRGDTIWVNDYHLLLVPKMIREKHPQAMIGFFLHVAFPSSEVFRCLAMRKQILEGMLGANVIGFQTDDHCNHFKQTCSRLLYVETTEIGIQLDRSFVNIVSLPIGIDPGRLARDIEALDVETIAAEYRKRYADLKVIVGRDKLDHVKGVKQKLLAYEQFLQTNPNWQGRVVMLQFGTALKTDALSAGQITDIVARINSKYSIIAKDYQPVIMRPDVSYQEYLALLTMADLFMVTSLREGMNLTCHEYVYCQLKRKNPLILSEFVGSATVLDKDAIMINPFDYKQTADAIVTGLEMSSTEKAEHWQGLYQVISEDDGALWAQTFIRKIQTDYISQMRKRSVDLPRFNPEQFAKQYRDSAKRLVFIDYEGTLLKWAPQQQIMAGTGNIVDLLNRLCSDERNLVYVTSERTPSELDRTFRRVHRLGLMAENGGYIRVPDGDWESLTEDSDLSWKDNVRQTVSYYKERTPGTFIEEQNNRIVFHYATADDIGLAHRQVSEMNNHIYETCAAQNAHTLPMDGALVIEPAAINKATAAQTIVSAMQDDPPTFLICFGNDRADEEIFAWTNTFPSRTRSQCTALTVTVGVRSTEAKTYVDSPHGVLVSLTSLVELGSRPTAVL